MATYRHRFAHLDALALTTGLWFLAKFLRYAFPPLFDPLKVVFGVSSSALGLAFAGFLTCYAVMQFPSGILGDRIGSVLVMVAGATLAGLAAMSLVVEAGFGILVAVMLVIGAGTGLHKTVSVTLLARVYPGRTGRALGIHETFGTGAGVVAPIAAIVFLGRVGWRWLFLVAGVIGLGIAALAAWRIPARIAKRVPSRQVKRSNPSLGRYVRLFRNRRFTLFALVTIMYSFAYSGAVAFLPLYLTDVGNLSIETAGLLYSLLFAATIVQLLTGELSDRVGHWRVLSGCLVLGLGGLVLVLVLSGPLALGIAVLTFGVGSHGYRPVRDAYLTSLIPANAAGGGIGLVRSLLMGSGALSPAVVGIIADVAGFRPAFWLLAGSLLLSVIFVGLLVVVPDRGPAINDPPSA